MERPAGYLTIRIVWLIVLCGSSDPIGHHSTWFTIHRQTRSLVDSPPIQTPSKAINCSSDECHFQLGNLTCRQVSHFDADYLSSCSGSIVSLDISHGKFRTINESGLLRADFPVLRRLSIRNSVDLEVLETLPSADELVELELVNNTKLESIYLPSRTRLKQLNLSDNNLQYIQDLSIAFNLSSLDLSGNRWDCQFDFKWALELHERGVLLNGDNLICQDVTHEESWINWRYSIIRQEINKRKVDAECRDRTARCSCQFASLGREGRESYTVQVDCSGRQLTSLPAKLPDFTNELDVSENDLTSLDQVIHYQPLKSIIADSNRIESIRNLSKSAFIRNFSLFSLKNNFISPSEIPLEDLTKVPDQFQGRYVYLYNNSWECDCNMATTVREWLWKNHHIVNDSSLLLCSRDGKKIPVLYLLPNAVCPSKDYPYLDDESSMAALLEMNERKISLFHSIIYIEVVLIVMLGVKLAFDSWHYFRHGQLPWIATKLL